MLAANAQLLLDALRLTLPQLQQLRSPRSLVWRVCHMLVHTGSDDMWGLGSWSIAAQN